MRSFTAKCYPYNILYRGNDIVSKVFPYFRSETGDMTMRLVSPQHGRSFVVGRVNGRYIISKGNGLSYTTQTAIQTRENKFDVLGLLSKCDAIRDFKLGIEVRDIGIKTNVMEYVLELDYNLQVNDKEIKPILLQYSLECPYRISDAAFMDSALIMSFVEKWRDVNIWDCDKYYKIAANILVRNLQKLHSHGILHNAINSQNYTWALELLDFELACSAQYPYDNIDYQRHVPDLFQREIIYTYQVILDIAAILREDVDFNFLDSLFMKHNLTL